MPRSTQARYDAAIKNMAADAAKHVSLDGDAVVGFGSGRAAAAAAAEIARAVKSRGLRITGVPTSLQIKLVIESEAGHAIPLIEADQVDSIDIVLDGADQIDQNGYVVKGGGGALLRENILFSMAKKKIIMADETKFVKNITRPIPVEVHRLARRLVSRRIKDIGGEPRLRIQETGYPVVTENGNIILDCSFGTIQDPKRLTASIKRIPGVQESGIFAERPDIIYKAGTRGRFLEISTRGKKQMVA